MKNKYSVNSLLANVLIEQKRTNDLLSALLGEQKNSVGLLFENFSLIAESAVKTSDILGRG